MDQKLNPSPRSGRKRGNRDSGGESLKEPTPEGYNGHLLDATPEERGLI